MFSAKPCTVSKLVGHKSITEAPLSRVTLKDIARDVGVSVMTVSNVVNGNLSRVSPETAARVEEAIAASGYVPNAAAQSLAARRTRLVGLLLPSGPQDASLLVSPHDVSVAGALEATLRAKDYHLMLRGASNARDVRDSVQRWSLDGIVVMGFTDDELSRLDLPDGLPAVVIDSAFGDHATLLHVRSDDFVGGRLAAEHLTALGHRRVAFCGPVRTTSQVVSARLAGFASGVAAAGLADDDLPRLDADTTFTAGVDVGHRLADARAASPAGCPTAVFATADILAAGIMRGLSERGVRVPDDVSVIGYDDADLAQYVTPRLSTIAQDTPRKGQAAARLLLATIEGANSPRAEQIAVSLIARESTASAPA